MGVGNGIWVTLAWKSDGTLTHFGKGAFENYTLSSLYDISTATPSGIVTLMDDLTGPGIDEWQPIFNTSGPSQAQYGGDFLWTMTDANSVESTHSYVGFFGITV